jgi:hypothetical protein
MIQNINAPHLKHSPVRRTFHEEKNNFQPHLQKKQNSYVLLSLAKEYS